MSFICERCGIPQPNRTTPIKKIVKTRDKVYPPRYKDGKCIDKGGEGIEIGKEMSLCSICSRIL